MVRLMPKNCEYYNDSYLTISGSNPEVSCARLNVMACPKYINKKMINHMRIKYICGACEFNISQDIGLDAIYTIYNLIEDEEETATYEEEEENIKND